MGRDPRAGELVMNEAQFRMGLIFLLSFASLTPKFNIPLFLLPIRPFLERHHYFLKKK